MWPEMSMKPAPCRHRGQAFLLSSTWRVLASSDYHAVWRWTHPSLLTLMSSSQTAGLVCVTGYFQWPQCECTVCLYVSPVCSDWNGRMCHGCLLENVSPCLLRLCVCVVVVFRFVFDSSLPSSSLAFLRVIKESLSRGRSGDEVTITHYPLCN